MLSNVKFVQEKRLISRFFDEISQDTGKFVFSVKDTLACLEMGAVEVLIVWENLDCDRWEGFQLHEFSIRTCTMIASVSPVSLSPHLGQSCRMGVIGQCTPDLACRTPAVDS